MLALLDPNIVPQDFDVFMTYEDIEETVLKSLYGVTDLSMLGINNNHRRLTRLVFNRDTRDLLSDIQKDVENNIFNRYGDDSWSRREE